MFKKKDINKLTWKFSNPNMSNIPIKWKLSGPLIFALIFDITQRNKLE